MAENFDDKAPHSISKGAENMENQNTTVTAPEQFPLKWHHFLTRFSLWVAMVISVISGITMAIGVQYEGQAEWVFRIYPSLRVLHIAYLIASIGIAVYTFIVRGRLARFEWTGVEGLTRLYILNPLLSLVHTVLMYAIANVEMETAFMDLLSPFVGAVAAILINKTYYGKRAALFTKE